MNGYAQGKLRVRTAAAAEWHRWEPHIHAPGTVLNDQFGTADPWGPYLTTLEGLTPKIEALAVADYYVTDTYEELLKHKSNGRLPSVMLLFPNIELRLDVAAKSGFVNVHLLISPEDADHLYEVKRLLKRLQFHAFDDRFDCTREELIKLGKRADPTITDDGAALRYGATQFKVNFDQLRKVIGESEWATKNVLIGVAGGSGDGTSGVRQPPTPPSARRSRSFSHIIFSSSAAQREFWIGQRGMTIEDLRARYDGCKPCLHGSDSQGQQSVGQPIDNRFSWIKGAWTSMPSVRPASTPKAELMSASNRHIRPCRRRSSRTSGSTMRTGRPRPTSLSTPALSPS